MRLRRRYLDIEIYRRMTAARVSLVAMAELRLEELGADDRGRREQPRPSSRVRRRSSSPRPTTTLEQTLDPANSWPRVVLDEATRVVGYIMGNLRRRRPRGLPAGGRLALEVAGEGTGHGRGRIRRQGIRRRGPRPRIRSRHGRVGERARGCSSRRSDSRSSARRRTARISAP